MKTTTRTKSGCWALCLALAIGTATTASAATITVSLDPTNTLSGNNTIAGWGADITNNTSMWVLFNSVQNSGVLAPFASSDFTDLLSPWVFSNAYALAPNATLNLPFIAGVQGLAQFSFPTSLFGFTGPSVNLELDTELFDVNPFTSVPSVDLPQAPLFFPVQYNESAPIVAAAGGVPEPATTGVVAASLIALWRAIRLKNSPKLRTETYSER